MKHVMRLEKHIKICVQHIMQV